jgi:hypothetical protein
MGFWSESRNGDQNVLSSAGGAARCRPAQANKASPQAANANAEGANRRQRSTPVVFFGDDGSAAAGAGTAVPVQQLVGPQALWDNVSAPGGSLMSMGGAVSNYHSLQLTATQRSRWGLTFMASYTFAKSIDNSSQRGGNTSSAGTAQNSLDLSSERSLSSFDVRHRFSFAHTYELPFGAGRRYLSRLTGPLAHALGGWSASGITTFSTGTPRTARSNSSLNRTGTATYAERPNATGLSSTLPADQRTIDEYFNTAAYASTPAIPGTSPVIYYFGNAGRNTITAPSRVNVDMSLLKTAKLSERVHLQFRAEAFNVFNITNWGLSYRKAFSIRAAGRTRRSAGSLSRSRTARCSSAYASAPEARRRHSDTQV